MADLAHASLEEIRRNGWSPILVLEAREAEFQRLAAECSSVTGRLCAETAVRDHRFALDLLRAGARTSEGVNAPGAI